MKSGLVEISASIFAYALPFRGKLYAIAASGCVIGAASVVDLYLLRYFIDTLLESRNVRGLWTAFGLLSIATCLQGIAIYVFTRAVKRLQFDVCNAIRADLFRKVLVLSIEHLRQRRAGDLLNQMVAETAAFDEGIWILSEAYKKLLLLAALLVAVFTMNWQLGAGGLLLLVPLMIYYWRAMLPLQRLSEAVQGAGSGVSQRFLELIRAAPMIRIYGVEERSLRDFGGLTQSSVAAGMGLVLNQTGTTAAFNLAYLTGLAMVFLLQEAGVREGRTSVGSLIIGASAIRILYYPVSELFGYLRKLTQLRGTATRLLETLESARTVEDLGARELPRQVDEIAFTEVGFRYPDTDRTVLSGASFRVRRGEVMAILGGNGEGKSTLLSLLPRFYEATEGEIRINGEAIREWSLKSLRSRMAMVSQDMALFDETVAENIAYAKPGATPHEIRAAAEAAHAAEFIERLPLGYETRVGERGSLLSEGQRQRLAIARAFLRDAPILLLDEPTSALDAASKQVVRDALARLMQDRIVFLVTHHPDELPPRARRFELRQGMLVEQAPSPE